MEIISGSKAARNGVVISPNHSVREATATCGKDGWKKVAYGGGVDVDTFSTTQSELLGSLHRKKIKELKGMGAGLI